MRSFDPMSRRLRVDAQVAEFGEASITVSLGCADFKRCELDCSSRGVCNPTFGTCTCDPIPFYNHTTLHWGGGCQYQYCPNDCSGKGNCDIVSGECTCYERWYAITPPSQ
eukprot:COSAG05_NODE_7894_length_758_cov_1.283763_1_plen_110_part_00